jgi:phospholipid/cholesterol/gamma-HCH transport system substrate-binding protein
MRAQDRSNLVKVGIFVTSLTIVLAIMITAIGKESSMFSPKATIKARVINAENLKVGSTVELRGLRIGHVEDIKIVGYQEVEILINIIAENLKWIRKDSKVAISNAGLVGDKYLEIQGGTSEGGDFNPEKDILQSEPSLDFKAMATKGGNIADKADRVLDKVEVMRMAIDAKKLAVTVDGLAKTADNLGKATGPLVATSKKLESASERFDAVMTRVQKGPGTAHSLVYDDGLYEDLRKLMGGAERNSIIKYFIRESIKKAPPKED